MLEKISAQNMNFRKKLMRSFSNIFVSRIKSTTKSLAESEYVWCGLVKVEKGKEELQPSTGTPVPLISVDVTASVFCAVAQVEVTQVYVNSEKKPIEAIYYFPINPEGSVTHFQADFEGKTIKGTVKPHEEAKEIYENAIKNQTTAFLGEETKADIFKLRVGFLEPGSQVKVIIGYITEVKNEPGSNAIRFYIPTTIAPRYVSPTESDEKVEDIKTMQFSTSSPAPLSLKVVVYSHGKIKSIECITHKVIVEDMGPIRDNPKWERAIVELAGTSNDMDRDFVLSILPEEVHKPSLYCEKIEGKPNVAMVHLVPSFRLDEQKSELVFVLDRSGSMTGQSIGLARKALLIFLHSMPADCYFNVVGFGSTFKCLFPNSVKYDDRSLKIAHRHAKEVQADLGGTEILEPLINIYGMSSIKGYLKQIFVLTDGQVCNTEEVIGIVRANAHSVRVFALGIGDGASHHLVEGIAKAGGGTSAFVTYNESINKKVLNQLKNALQPSLTDIQLEWEGIKTHPSSQKQEVLINKEKPLLGYNKPIQTEPSDLSTFKQCPNKIPPLFDGSQLLVFGLFNDEVPNAVTVKANSPDGPLSLRIELSPENKIGLKSTLHRMAAVKLIRELELEAAALHYQQHSKITRDKDDIKKEIIQIGCENGITSKYTSFIAVDAMTDKPLDEIWVMESRHVPTQLVHAYLGGLQLLSARGACSSMSSYDDCNKKGRSKSLLCSDSSSNDYTRCYDGSLRAMSMAAQSCEEREKTEFVTTLEKLISLQSFNGWFALDEKLAKIIGRNLKKLKQAATAEGLQESVFATAMAVAFFSMELSEEKDEWELVVEKAKKWLAEQTSKSDEIIKSAEFYLKNHL